MNHSTPGLPVHHQLPVFTQTHVHQVSDAIQPSHPLSSPSPPAPNPSQHKGLFQWVNSSHAVARVLEFQLQHQSFQWTPRTWSPLGWTGWISLQSKGLSWVFSKFLALHIIQAQITSCFLIPKPYLEAIFPSTSNLSFPEYYMALHHITLLYPLVPRPQMLLPPFCLPSLQIYFSTFAQYARRVSCSFFPNLPPRS